MAVGPAVAYADHEVGGQHGLVAVAVAGLQAHHASHQYVIVRDGAPAHQGGDDRNVQQFGQFNQLRGGAGVDDAATGNDQRALGCGQHVQGLFQLLAAGLGLLDGDGLVGVDVEFDLGHLHVERQVQQDRAGTAGAHQLEGLLEGARNLAGFHDGHGHLGDGGGDGLDVHGLEVFLVQLGHGGLAGDAEHGDGIRPGCVQAGDHVGAGRARGADADADVAIFGAAVAVRHVAGAFNVAGQRVADAAVLPHCRVERVDCRAWQAERLDGALLFQNCDGSVNGAHLGHCVLLESLWWCSMVELGPRPPGSLAELRG